MSVFGVSSYNSSKSIKLRPSEHDELDRKLLKQKLRPSIHADFSSDFEEILTESLVELACPSEPLTVVLEEQPEMPFSEPRDLGNIFNKENKTMAKTTNNNDSDLVTELSAKNLYYLNKAFSEKNWNDLKNSNLPTRNNAALAIGKEISQLCASSTNIMQAYGGKFQQKYRKLAKELLDFIVNEANNFTGNVDDFVNNKIKDKLTEFIASNTFKSSEEIEYFLTACTALWKPFVDQNGKPVWDYTVSLKPNNDDASIKFNVNPLLFKAYHKWIKDKQINEIEPTSTTETETETETETAAEEEE